MGAKNDLALFLALESVNECGNLSYDSRVQGQFWLLKEEERIAFKKRPKQPKQPQCAIRKLIFSLFRAG